MAAAPIAPGDRLLAWLSLGRRFGGRLSCTRPDRPSRGRILAC